MTNVYRVYEGRRYSPVFWDAVSKWRSLCRTEGIPFVITQGGHNGGQVSASASTHNGDAVDISARNMTEKQAERLVRIGRMVGIAVWFRTTSTPKWGTRAQGFSSYHFHGVPNKWGHPSPAADRQADSYRNGRDGLVRNLSDIGPGHTKSYQRQTWHSYNKSIQGKPTPSLPKTGDGMSEAMVRKVVQEEIRNYFNTKVRAGGKDDSILGHLLSDTVFGYARSVAVGELRNQIRAVAAELNVSIEDAQSSIISEVQDELGDSVQDAIKEHFPSIEQAQSEEIARTFFDILVERISNDHIKREVTLSE